MAPPRPPALADLETLARRGRWLVISTVAGSGGGHVGGPLSAMDMLVALFFRVLRVRPAEPGWPKRDRFILSKGHSSIGLYAVMAMRGYLPVEELKTFDKGDSRLLGNLTAIVDQNGLQQYGWPLPDGEAHPGDRADPWPGTRLGAAFEAFGWRVVEIDGHDFGAIVAACEGSRGAASDGRPTAILARTVKGKGLSFTEGRHHWHSRVATPDEVAQARLELGIDEQGIPR